MWNQRYAEPGYAYGTEPNDFLREQASRIPTGRVLCLAEGEGRNAVYLAERGYQVLAVDASSVGIDKTRALAEQRGVQVEAVVSDLAEYRLGESAFEGIVSVWCHLPPQLRRELHRQVVVALKPGGILILEAYTPRQLGYGTGGPPNEALTMTLAALNTELAGLEFLVAREVEREIHEGKYHDGPSHVVQVVARRPEATD